MRSRQRSKQNLHNLPMHGKLGEDGVKRHDTGTKDDDMGFLIHQEVCLSDILAADGGGLLGIVTTTKADYST